MADHLSRDSSTEERKKTKCIFFTLRSLVCNCHFIAFILHFRDRKSLVDNDGGA